MATVLQRAAAVIARALYEEQRAKVPSNDPLIALVGVPWAQAPTVVREEWVATCTPLAEALVADGLLKDDGKPDGAVDPSEGPRPEDPRCTFTFPLPSWAGEDQTSPCRCDLPAGHAPTDHPSGHACAHTRGDRDAD